MATTHIDYRKIDYDQLLDKPIIRTDASVDTLTTAGVYDKWDGKRYIVSVNGQNITQVIEEKDWYQTRSSTDGGTTWGAWETVVFSKSGDIDAEDVNYDNTTSELVATNVQAAIDEIDTSVDDVKEDITDIQTDITNIQWDITNIQGDITEIKNIIEVTTMDTPSEDNEGSIVQYKWATNANFTHWYFYECVSDGQTPATYSWVRIDVQPAWAWDEHEFITQAAYDLLTPAQKAAKVYMIKEEWVPGSWLIAWAGIDITNNTISADMSTAVYDNTTSGATATNVQDAIDEVFQSVSNGKELIADAITDKGVSTSATDSFQTMADNIESLTVWGKYGEWSIGDVLHYTTSGVTAQTVCYSNSQTENWDTVYYYGTGFKRSNTSSHFDITLVKYNNTNKKMFVTHFDWRWNSWNSDTRFKFFKDWDKVWFADTYWTTILFWYFDSTNQFVQASTWADTSNDITQFCDNVDGSNDGEIRATLWRRTFVNMRAWTTASWPKVCFVV